MVKAETSCSRRLRDLLDEAAKEQHRTRSLQLHRYLVEGLRRDGKLKGGEAA